MKYMGSKRAMLKNGLGDLLDRTVPNHRRFFDLFSGSGAVAAFVAQRFETEVITYDLQYYAACLAADMVERTERLLPGPIWERWLARATKQFVAVNPPAILASSITAVERAREWSDSSNAGSLVSAYGGHYYSTEQVVWIQSFRGTLPKDRVHKTLCLAALIVASSKCAASPGHTAQPFQPTPTALIYLAGSWQKDIRWHIKSALDSLSSNQANIKGYANVGNANDAAILLNKEDLVFLDPPYSAVQYSRFYHVLEAIAKGRVSDVTGVGRYPGRSERPTSSFSQRSSSQIAIRDLLQTIASRGASAIVTFPNHECSNGLTGDIVMKEASLVFKVDHSSVSSTFSTLGGPSKGGTQQRMARRSADELLLYLTPL